MDGSEPVCISSGDGVELARLRLFLDGPHPGHRRPGHRHDAATERGAIGAGRELHGHAQPHLGGKRFPGDGAGVPAVRRERQQHPG